MKHVPLAEAELDGLEREILNMTDDEIAQELSRFNYSESDRDEFLNHFLGKDRGGDEKPPCSGFEVTRFHRIISTSLKSFKGFISTPSLAVCALIVCGMTFYLVNDISDRAIETSRYAMMETGLGLSKQDRQAVQIALKENGFEISDIDGLWGKETRSAISNWNASREYGNNSMYLSAETYKDLIQTPGVGAENETKNNAENETNIGVQEFQLAFTENMDRSVMQGTGNSFSTDFEDLLEMDKEYTVKQGDSLRKFAKRLTGSVGNWRAIAEANDIPEHEVDTIYPGQKLVVPAELILPSFDPDPATEQTDLFASNFIIGNFPNRGNGNIRNISYQISNVGSTDRIPHFYTGRWVWPVGDDSAAFNSVSTEGFGLRIRGQYESPVFAAATGNVMFAGPSENGNGSAVKIKHADSYTTIYSNIKDLRVSEEDNVSSGQQIGALAKDGKGNSFLYFEVIADGVTVNPLSIYGSERQSQKLTEQAIERLVESMKAMIPDPSSKQLDLVASDSMSGSEYNPKN